MLFDDVPHAFLDLRLTGHIHGERRPVLRLRGRDLCRLEIEIGINDASAIFRQQIGGRLANTASCAGDKGDLF